MTTAFLFLLVWLCVVCTAIGFHDLRAASIMRYGSERAAYGATRYLAFAGLFAFGAGWLA